MNKAIWATDCPECKEWVMLLYQKNGIATCAWCGAKYKTDSEDHPELPGNPVEYWLTDKIKEIEK
jgi:uncharacterized Zn finger protein (UPF0148 family)